MDQARRLRAKTDVAPTTIAFASGKGGVGKTNVCVNTAIGLVELGKRVLIVDLDIGMANVHILLNAAQSKTMVDSVKTRTPLASSVQKDVHGVDILHGGSGLDTLVQFSEADMQFLMRELEVLTTYDYVLFDMGAGATDTSLRFIEGCDEMFLILTPEPTSLMDGYAYTKLVHRQSPDLPIGVIVNRAQSGEEALQCYERMEVACRQFLNKPIRFLGFLPDDASVRKAVIAQVPFYQFDRKSDISWRLERILTTLTGTPPKPRHFMDRLIGNLRQQWKRV
ncbi:MinD/ParA family protein [Exiguobacterium sp. SH3S2]|uniref:MinD/ParA family protein n=1 Tax=Exiguobacterium TaxID=33986 RepID=UPI000877708F|nr:MULTISPECIES: MinD/ParA family protein [Exiguobacterium]TCI27419.1 MinD/ParA family protein [Exiguobacterium sp. SH5S4]TCI37336.1 MinD/ParA family protein [Exiguobacterium sp. SH4S7]TCI45466.1 MinD/ParA family protein [Exiguobacterium sp. SH5S32]TCI49258.1 MinD/ParA family protein [Exiguobacterium sp. SH3S3]TCI52667.1 MinD/ParA family protein [Exiguobacterium sp. SH1S4]